MRIFAIAECFPCVGRDGGALRLYHLLKAISANNIVDLACFSKFDPEDSMWGEVKKFLNEVKAVKIGAPVFLLNCAKGFFSKTPSNVLAYSCGEMIMVVKSFLARNRYDLIYIYRLRMAPYAEAYEGTPRILDLTDSLTLYLERKLEVERRPISRYYLRRELQKMSRYEPEAIKRVNLALVSSRPDMLRLLAESSKGKIRVVENGVDCDYFAPDYRSESKSPTATIAFHGNMDYSPNCDAVENFCRNALPQLRLRWPELKLNVIGRNPPRRIKELSKMGGVAVSGAVEDVRPHLKPAWLYVAPLRFAAGTQIKVLEAMAMGLPVVASGLCASAFEPEAESAMRVAKDEADFVAQIDDLLASPSRREELGDAGRRFVEEKFSWTHMGRTLNELCSGVVMSSTLKA